MYKRQARAFIENGDRRNAMAVIADLPESPQRRMLQEEVSLRRADVSTSVNDDDASLPPDKLRAMALDALTTGDLNRALELTLARLDQDGLPSTAETAALLAAALGRRGIPVEASEVLDAAASDRRSRLDKLFNDDLPVDPAEPMAGTLSRLDREIEAIESLLTDG